MTFQEPDGSTASGAPGSVAGGEALTADEIAERVAAARRELGIDSVRQPQVNTAAMAALVLGLFGMVCLGFFTAVPAIICGVVGLRRAASSGDGKIMSIFGIVAGLIGTAWSVHYAISLMS